MENSTGAAYALWQQLLLRQSVGALEVLQQAGVRTLLIKGAAALCAGWWQPGQRPVTDADVLIPPVQLRRACDVLREQGWTPCFTLPPHPQTHRHSGAFRSPHGFFLDLHWFSLRHCRWAGVDDLLWQNAREVLYENHRVQIPCPEHYLVHSIGHGARVDSDTEVWREDVRMVLTNHKLCPDRLREAAQNYRLAPLVGRALRSVRAHGPISPAKAMLQEVLDREGTLSWRDRTFLHFATHHRQQPGPSQMLLVWLDYHRLKTHGPGFDLPLWEYLRHRWDLDSARKIPSTFLGFCRQTLRRWAAQTRAFLRHHTEPGKSARSS